MNKNLSKCTGCAACYNKCPVGAISMQENEEGFLYPIIDKEKCTNCGICKEVCPIENINYLETKHKYAYALAANDEIRKNSSSGGIFYLIANYILNNNGYVCGAAFSNDFQKVEHIIISKNEEIKKLQTSKYLQSKIGDSYKQIRELLEKECLVLFSGTPCQVEGLNKFLNKKYENLITIDILCHGVPSPKVWRYYLESIINNRKIKNINFRAKDKGWQSPLNLKIEYTNNEFFNDFSNINNYYKAFLSNLILRRSCSICEYTNLNRVSDITLGDFWGINKFNKKINDNKGLSLCLLNTEKGETIFDLIKKELKICCSVPIKYAIKGNPNLIRPSIENINRNLFFKNLNKNIFNEMDKYLIKKQKYDGIITNFWFTSINYGAVLTAYAIQQLFKEKNLDYRFLNYYKFNNYKKHKDTPAKPFIEKYLLKTHEIKSKKELQELNQYSDNFVVGSDQVFRYEYVKKDLDIYFLTYSDFSKRRIAFSASFGTNNFEADLENTYKIEKYLKRFNTITTREIDGINLCKNTFGINNVTQLLDPVFLVDKSKFLELINNSKKEFYKNKIACYILDQSEETRNQLNKIAEISGLEIVNIRDLKLSVEEFLTVIKFSRMLFTDSFHGVCFALLFHKNFRCYKNIQRGNSRFETLINIFGIDNNFVSKYSDMQIPSENEINWDKIEQIIKNEKEKMNIWFQKTFIEPISYSNEQIANEFDFINISKPKFNLKKFIFNKQKTKTRKIITILGIKFKFKRKS